MANYINPIEGLKSVLQTYCEKYDKSFPYFRQPTEVGSFSLDEQRIFHHNRSQLKNYHPPRNVECCQFDLNHGYSQMIKKDESVKEKIDNMLKWIMENKDRFTIKKDKTIDDSTLDFFKGLSTDFVCWRGLLTRLMCLPYENKEDLMLGVIKFRGTYFLCEFETEAKKRQKIETTPRQEAMCAWGFKFEQYVTAGVSEEQPNTSCPVNLNPEFGSVVRTRLENHSLVYGAEVDCKDPLIKERIKYIELKTSRLIETQRQHENFCKFKLLKWWAQSFLIGIQEVVCGFRDDQGVVKCLQSYQVSQMPVEAKETLRYPWKPNVCFNFLRSFFDFIKANVTEENERCVHLFHSTPGKDIAYIRKTKEPDFTFLPQWFISWDAWDKPV